jgi:hypothetical protein
LVLSCALDHRRYTPIDPKIWRSHASSNRVERGSLTMC